MRATAIRRAEFEQFVAQSTSGLLRTAFLLVGDLPEAEDLVQECLLVVAKRWPRVRSMEHPRAYARRVLLNLALDGTQKRSQRRRELLHDRTGDAPDEAATRELSAIQPLGARDGAWHPSAPPARGARPALLRRPLRGAGRRGPRLLDRNGEEQRLPRVSPSAAGDPSVENPDTEGVGT